MSWSDLLRSNPVFAIEAELERADRDPEVWAASAGLLDPVVDALRGRGQRIPAARVHRWSTAGLLSPRLAMQVAGVPPWAVLGLVAEAGVEQGFVVPLEAGLAADWAVTPALPVRAERIADLLARIVEAVAPEVGTGRLPERFAFRLGTPFPRPSLGRSMDVAALLAVLLAAGSGRSPARPVAAVVEADGDRLAPVERINVKLCAFEREVGEGGILVRHPDCPSAGRWDQDFEEVWTVATCAELGRVLLRAGWLDGMLTAVPLAADALPRIEARLERLLRAHDHRSVLGLTRRLLEVEAGQDLPRTAGLRVMQARLASLRHLGYSTEALELAARLRATTVELGPALSHDDRALADLECAASLFDPGRFPELLELLEPWRERCGADPLLLPASTRIRIWNTIARARIASGAAGWEVLLDASVDLQRQTDPAGCVRTANYRIEGLLRAGRLDEAAAAIARNLAEVGAEDRYSQRMIASYRAQHARRAGARWQAEDADRALAGPIADELGPWHPLGLYELAVARQAGRGADEVERRLERAARAFAADQPEGGEPGPLRLLELVARLGAAEASAVPARVAAARAALGGLGLPGPVGAEVDRIVADAEGPAFGILCDALPWC